VVRMVYLYPWCTSLQSTTTAIALVSGHAHADGMKDEPQTPKPAAARNAEYRVGMTRKLDAIQKDLAEVQATLRELLEQPPPLRGRKAELSAR
jgi:hypothetical protein